MKVSITRNLALGNGTRPKGFVLGDTDTKDPAKVTPKNTKLAAGVLPVELETLMENQQYMLVDGDLPKPDDDLVDPFAMQTKPNYVPPPESKTVAQEESESEVEPDDQAKRALPIADLGLKAQQSKPLVDAGLDTVGKLIDFAEENNGLTTISGVGEPTEKAVAEALQKLFEPAQ